MLTFITLLKDDFESSAELTPQFQHFYRIFCNEFKRLLKEKFNTTNVKFNRGHFYIFGFFKIANGNIYYFSVGDVRWYKEEMLIRTATHFKDYTGGSNCFISLESEDDFISGLQREVK